MVRFLNNLEIKNDYWDNAIGKSGITDVYPNSWYLDLMCPGWCAISDDDYSSVFPIPENRKYGIRYIYTPMFLQKLGLYSIKELSPGEIDLFITEISSRYKFIDLSIHNNIQNPGVELEGRGNYILSLNKSYEEICKGYSTDCRRNIKISKDTPQKVVSGVKPEEAIDLFRRGPGRSLKNIRTEDYGRLKNLMRFCQSTNRGDILGVYKNNILTYSLFYISERERITLLFTSTSAHSRDIRSGYRVVDQLVEENASRNVILDFAGSSIPSIENFIKSFGATKQEYFRFYQNRLMFPFRYIK